MIEVRSLLEKMKSTLPKGTGKAEQTGEMIIFLFCYKLQIFGFLKLEITHVFGDLSLLLFDSRVRLPFSKGKDVNLERNREPYREKPKLS